MHPEIFTISSFINARDLATLDLVVQLALFAAILVASYLSRVKHKFKIHCLILRVAIPLELVLVLVMMLPGMLGYIDAGNRGSLFSLIMYTHHALGLVVIGIWIYINLVFQRVIKGLRGLKVWMRISLVTWFVVTGIGIWLYMVTWVN